MELVTGPPQLHATDVVAIVHASGHASCSNFNLAVNKGILGTVRASVDINGRATDLVMMHDQQAGCFVFPGGKLRPEPQVLLSLPLLSGCNKMEFRVLDNASGVRIAVFADLWLWQASDRIVVVDVDGTITKSDVRGLVASQLQTTTSFLSNAFTASINPWTQDIATALNTDYTHDGVADALTHIAQSDYRILYLTARPITLAEQTREFLASVGRSQNSALPDGPLITQPHGTIKALQTKHELFKIEVLTQIQELYDSAVDGVHGSPSKSVPVAFVAGFGNHETDVLAYSTAGIPPSHIFVLDKASNLRIQGSGVELQSYTGLLQHLPVLFPPLRNSTRPGRSFGSPGHSAPGYSSVNGAQDTGGQRSASRSHVAPAPPKTWGGVTDLAGFWKDGGAENEALKRQSTGETATYWSAREFMSNVIPLKCTGVQWSAHGSDDMLGHSSAPQHTLSQHAAAAIRQSPQVGVVEAAHSHRYPSSHAHAQQFGAPQQYQLAQQQAQRPQLAQHVGHDGNRLDARAHAPRYDFHADSRAACPPYAQQRTEQQQSRDVLYSQEQGGGLQAEGSHPGEVSFSF